MGTKTQRLGLMCGTFDPPHLGHLLLAETLRLALGLHQVLFIPVGEPPHKPQGVTAVAQRQAMTQLAIADHPDFKLDTTDIERPAPHFTYTLIPHIQRQYPQAELWLLIGSDSLQDLPTWQSPQRLLESCRLAVLDRPGYPIDLAALEESLPGVSERIECVDGIGMRISSTWLRQRLASGEPLRYVVPPAVAEYIQSERLYRDGDT